MIYDEIELQIKQVSADLQILEENMRNNSPAYQRVMGQLDVLLQLQKEKECDTDVDTRTEAEESS